MSSALSLVVNNISGEDVHVYVQATAANCDVTYLDSSKGTQTSVKFTVPNVLSDPIPLVNVKSGAFTINKLVSGVIFFTYGKNKFDSSVSAPDVASCKVPFSVIEITRNNPPVAGDAGDLTAINYFTAPIALKSYDAAGTPLQEKAFSSHTSDIFTQLYNVAPSATIVDGGTPIRVLSAYEYATQKNLSPYKTFDAYLKAVNHAGQSTNINNKAAWNNPANTGSGNYVNYEFEFNFSAKVDANASGSGYDVNLTNGTIKVTSIAYANKQPSGHGTKTVAENLTVKLDGSNDVALNQLIYGQAINGAVHFSDAGHQGWSALKTYIEQNVPHQNVYNILQSLIIGEITSGFLFGFINSAEMIKGTPIKDMPSHQWWTLSPNAGYSAAHPNHAFYDPYAAVICATSGNQVYGAAYGDRFVNPAHNPTIESSSYQGKAVAKWEATLLPPITTCPIPQDA